MFDRTSDGLWWDQAWTLTRGCTAVSPGCDHCWSREMSHRRRNNPAVASQYGMTTEAGAWTGRQWLELPAVGR